MKFFCHLAFSLLLLPFMVYGEDIDYHQIKEPSSNVEALSVDLRRLLAEEMRALQKGMTSIIPAYISGDWDEIASIAGSMKDGYILKQNITQIQAKELHSILPRAFIEQDQHFHYLAGMLQHVAENKNAELVNFYFSKMNEACMACHSNFAQYRFPFLVMKKSKLKK